MFKNFFLLTLVLAASFGPGSSGAQTRAAEDFPSKTVRIIVPYAPGGGVDLIARLVAKQLAEKWSRGVIVENKPGAGTVIATDYLLKAPPDGTTIMLATTALATNISLVAKLPYDTLRDIRPVVLAAMAPVVIVVRPSMAASTLKDLIAYAKAHPGKLNYGYPGVGTSNHLAAELFKAHAQVDALGLSYKGTQPMLTAMLAGEIDYMFDNTTSLPFVKAGRLRALAVTSSKRLTSMPEIPTVAESLPGYEAITWYGFVVRSGTPPDIVNVLNREINAALKNPDVYDRITSQGMEVQGSTQQEFDLHLRAEAKKWAKVVRDAHIQPQ
jgi:tripartite-type tricarboxylate transporter receptor subunit TctC